MEIKENGDQGSDTTCRIESMSRGGVIRLLDQIRIYHFPNFSLWQILAILAQVKQSSHNSSKHAKEDMQQKVKHATCKNVKGRVWRIQTQLETRMFLSWFR